MHRLVLFVLFVLCAAPRITLGADVVRDSVVKIHSTLRTPDFNRLWSKANPKQVSGSGAIIAGNRILTNAHVVLYASRVLVQANQSTERMPATVEAIAPGMDLAVLKLDDESFFEDRPTLELTKDLPKIKNPVSAYGFPIGGEQLSVTEGIISRVEYMPYKYNESGLRIQVDAALNPGNSGGPAIADGKILGLVFSQSRNADNIGYLIPADEVQMFLDDVEDGKYDGKRKLFGHFQTVENVALRQSLKLDAATGGLMVTRPYGTDGTALLKERDVITHIGEYALDNQGKIQMGEELRLSFHYLVPKLTKNEKIGLTIFRDGKSMEIEVPSQYRRDVLVPYLRGEYPPHFICGPMLFTTASQDLLTGLRGTGQLVLAMRENPLVTRRFDRMSFPGEQIVLLGPRMFTSPISEGYDSQTLGVVSQVNDVTIKNLTHLVETIRNAQGKFLSIKIAGNYETMVFDRQALIDSTEMILEDEGIRYQMSEEFRDVWGDN